MIKSILKIALCFSLAVAGLSVRADTLTGQFNYVTNLGNTNTITTSVTNSYSNSATAVLTYATNSYTNVATTNLVTAVNLTQPGTTNVVGTNYVVTPVYTLYWGNAYTNLYGRQFIGVSGTITNLAGTNAIIDLVISNQAGIVTTDTWCSGQTASTASGTFFTINEILEPGDVVKLATNRFVGAVTLGLTAVTTKGF